MKTKKNINLNKFINGKVKNLDARLFKRIFATMIKKYILIGLLIITTSLSESKITKATYYHDKYVGRKAADGSIFSQKKLTAASNIYPLGTIVTVTNTKNKNTVTVKITDRLNKKYSDRIDLSKLAFKELDNLKKGILNVTVEVEKSNPL